MKVHVGELQVEVERYPEPGRCRWPWSHRWSAWSQRGNFTALQNGEKVRIGFTQARTCLKCNVLQMRKVTP